MSKSDSNLTTKPSVASFVSEQGKVLPEDWRKEISLLLKHHNSPKAVTGLSNSTDHILPVVELCDDASSPAPAPSRPLRILVRNGFSPDPHDLVAHAHEAVEYLRLTLENGFFDVLYPRWGDRGLDLFLLLNLLAKSLTPHDTSSSDITRLWRNRKIKSGLLWPLRGYGTSLLKQDCIALGRMDCNVMIHAPSGCGKEAIAQIIHIASLCNGPFHPVNVPTLPEGLFAAGAFGTAKQAATGVREHPGFFEAAKEGTLFLDEIADLGSLQQATLLRALAQKRGSRLGGGDEYEISCRILSATNKPVREYLKALRPDLRFRLEEQRLSSAVTANEAKPIKTLSQIREQLPLLTAIQLVRSVRRHLGGGFTAKSVQVTLVGAEGSHGVKALSEVGKSSLEWSGNHRELGGICNWAVLRAIKKVGSPYVCEPSQWEEDLYCSSQKYGIVFPLKLQSARDSYAAGNEAAIPVLPLPLLDEIALALADSGSWDAVENAWFCQVETHLKEKGLGTEEIAKLLGMDRSTVFRRRRPKT